MPRRFSFTLLHVLLAAALAGSCGRTPLLEFPEGYDGFGVIDGDGMLAADLRTRAPDLVEDLPVPRDLTVMTDLEPSPDLALEPPPDLADPGPDLLVKNPCGNFLPGCSSVGRPQPLPFSGDLAPPRGVADQNIQRDNNNGLVLSQTAHQFNFLWIAGTNDIGRGTISKIDSRTVKEVARYPTVTCFSLPGGGRVPCDGAAGCCSADDFTRYNNRQAGRPAGPHQAVQEFANFPSRTSLDWNGDAWVANRAFGGQSSVTKIANALASCTDWNKDGVIGTSSDANGNGVIDVDCNNNGQPDDLADVRGRACANGLRQEYFGLDDECVLLTTNTGDVNQVGRPLALQPGLTRTSASDAWAGTFNDGRFHRVDGTSGTIEAVAQGPANAYGAVVDAGGILWIAVFADGRLAYIDTAKLQQQFGRTRGATFPISAYGISLDRDGNVWEAGWTTANAYRYSPVRGNFAQLGQGNWTVVTAPGMISGATGNGRGIAADNRGKSWFVWMARDGGWITRISADLPIPAGFDMTVNGAAMPAVRVAGSNTIGVGLDHEGNVWGVSYDGSVATRIKVDAGGNMTPPDIASGPNNVGCPAGMGDRCPLGFKNAVNVNPYTYSDFSGYGLRNFSQPKGAWSMVVQSSCPGHTRWSKLTWTASVPANTTLMAKARSGSTPSPDMSWTSFSVPTDVSPAELEGKLGIGAGEYLQVWFDFTSADGLSTPILKSFDAIYQCY